MPVLETNVARLGAGACEASAVAVSSRLSSVSTHTLMFWKLLGGALMLVATGGSYYGSHCHSLLSGKGFLWFFFSLKKIYGQEGIMGTNRVFMA